MQSSLALLDVVKNVIPPSELVSDENGFLHSLASLMCSVSTEMPLLLVENVLDFFQLLLSHSLVAHREILRVLKHVGHRLRPNSALEISERVAESAHRFGTEDGASMESFRNAQKDLWNGFAWFSEKQTPHMFSWIEK